MLNLEKVDTLRFLQMRDLSETTEDEDISETDALSEGNWLCGFLCQVCCINLYGHLFLHNILCIIVNINVKVQIFL